MIVEMRLSRDADVETTARTLRTARVYRGYTQAYVASEAGINRETLAALEAGKRKRGPQANTLRRLAAVLDIPVEDLGL